MLLLVARRRGSAHLPHAGHGRLRNLDPFLMLDELRMPAPEASAGFPDHPHRGFETCSIMLSGRMEHRDSVGNHVRAASHALLACVRAPCPRMCGANANCAWAVTWQKLRNC